MKPMTEIVSPSNADRPSLKHLATFQALLFRDPLKLRGERRYYIEFSYMAGRKVITHDKSFTSISDQFAETLMNQMLRHVLAESVGDAYGTVEAESYLSREE